MIVIRNGFVWFVSLLGVSIGGYLLLSLNRRLAMFTILMATALIGVSLEAAAVMPTFSWAYQGGLAVGFEALLAVLVAFAFARVVLRAPEVKSRDGGPGKRVAAE